MEVVDSGPTCDICKVTYATSQELEDHNWSLMHHIKIEKIKKGAPHSCNLCMESCANIIEYGKHLNEDRHKLALSRQAKESSELLDSFALQNELVIKDKDYTTEAAYQQGGPGYYDHMEHQYRGRNFRNAQDQRGQGGRGHHGNKHSRSFSQPDLCKEMPSSYMSNESFAPNPAKNQNVDNWLKWIALDKGFDNMGWQQNTNFSDFKVPHGRPGHSRTQSDMRQNFSAAEGPFNDNRGNNDNFYSDNFNDINWRDNNFYSQKPGRYTDFEHNPYKWQRNDRGEENRNNRARRGSFDNSCFNQRNRNEGRFDYEDDRPKRGRSMQKTHGGGGRSRSYDNNSPESTSSSDSSLKRRLEIDDSFAPGKTRRRLGADTSNVLSSSTDTGYVSHSLMDEEANQRPRSRSTSRDRYRSNEQDKLESNRPPSRNSDKKVSWSDQQQVSSTTGSHSARGKTKNGKGKSTAQSKTSVLPDSSSEPDLIKTLISSDKGKKKAGAAKGKTSPRLQRKNNTGKDRAESVLEEAEKLCKKLRNEREKAKQKKQTEEKRKKFEKQQEINNKIETLSEKNKANIKGVLDTEIASINKEIPNEFLKLDGTTDFHRTSNKKSSEMLQIDESHKPQLIPEKLVNTSKSSPTILKESVKHDNSQKNITERIAQTRADIDAIRAKIETSVDRNLTPTKGLEEAFLSPSRTSPSTVDTSSLQGRYLQPSGTHSLLKMVNSPRTTKERNQLAQVLREHAKSQKKLTLPRFNLKFSDLCSDSDRQDEQVNIETLAPSVQLEIANIIEADVKPDIAELEKLLECASAGNAELDLNILSDLGVTSTSFATPPTLNYNAYTESRSDNRMQERVSSPMSFVPPEREISFYKEDHHSGRMKPQQSRQERGPSPVAQLFPRGQFQKNVSEIGKVSEKMDEYDKYARNVKVKDPSKCGQGLDIEDLEVRVPIDKKKETTGRYQADDFGAFSQNGDRFSSSLPLSQGKEDNSAALSSSVGLSNVRIKQEKIDDGYDKAVSDALFKAKAFFNKPSVDTSTLKSSENIDNIGDGRNSPQVGLAESRQTDVNSGRFSQVRKSIHTQNLYRDTESPVQDPERRTALQSETDGRTTLEKVTSILDGVPTPWVEVNGDKSSSATPSDTIPRHTQPIKEVHLDSSQHSQASILEEVYSVSIQEESVRQEISSVDFKISKLKSLIDEASQELRKCSQEKEKLMEQESSCRSKRLKLLEESRSSSACSQTAPSAGILGTLSQMQHENPMMLKFLMSQRHSDLSSVGGFSNVETGSQPDSEINPQRRGSMTSSITESVSHTGENQTHPESNLFSKSLEAVSDSTDTVTSIHHTPRDKSVENPTQSSLDTVKQAPDSDINTMNAVSMLNKPLERVGFVTLDALMKGDGDIGKLLNKSLESIEKGTIPEGASPLHKQSSNESRGSSGGARRERKDSTFSLDTGSDSEKKSVSLKYMGTLPEGTNYESIVRQVSQENRNKSLMITVLSSPEAMSQLRRTPDAGSTPIVKPKDEHMGIDIGYKSDGSSKTTSTQTLTHISDMESHSARSTFSLGEQIKRMCDGQNMNNEKEVATCSKESVELNNADLKFEGKSLIDVRNSPVKDCFVKLDKLYHSERSSPKTMTHDVGSPVRKKLKSKKERDQMSRRKQKENFILQSDTNSESENDSPSLNKLQLSSKITSKSEDDLVLTGSEDRTPRPMPVRERKKSLLDEVQLETETHSDSGEDKLSSQSIIHYKGPSLSVAVIQEFKDSLYVCYNGSEVRRFELKTGRILKELDCSPYLVNCLHVTSIEGRGDVLFTGGTCKKLMLFEPQKFSLISTFDYTERLTCLHEDWGRLFIGLSDGQVSVRSLKTDKELNCFSCTTSSVHSMGTSSAGMTKMLCLASGDKVIYVVDAITGLLITMLEGHTQPPRCLKVLGEYVISGGSDQALISNSITTGSLCKMAMCSQTITHIWCDNSTVYAAGCDSMIRTYNFNLKPGEMIQGSGKGIITCGIVKDRSIIIGKRDGDTEALPLDKHSQWTCNFGSCSLKFHVLSQFRLHVLSDHISDSIPHCTYRACNHIFTKQERRQDHVLSHLK